MAIRPEWWLSSTTTACCKKTSRLRALRLIQHHWALCIALLVATISTIVVIYYSSQPLLEFKSFRQTQTALTVYWMLKEGWRLGYETPVLGYPWSNSFRISTVPDYRSICFIYYQRIYRSCRTLGQFCISTRLRVASTSSNSAT